MNVYDFDDTIYDGDSGIDLIKYTILRHPLLIIKYAAKTIFVFIKYIFKKEKYKNIKEILFGFLIEIKDLNNYLDQFVNQNMKNIKEWYYERQKEEDLVISASYYMWIKKFCEKLNIKNVIATEINLDTGKIIGENCSREEKIKRYNKIYKNIKIIQAYSDSKKDIPLLEKALEGFVVKKNKIIKYAKGYRF